MRTESEQRSEEERETVCAKKKFKISRTDKILLSAVNLSIYISKTSNTAGAKECYEIMLRNRRVDAAGRGYLHHGVCNCATECHSYSAKPQPEEELNC